MSSRRAQKERARAERLAREARERASAKRRRRIALASAAGAVVVAVAVGVTLLTSSGGRHTAAGAPSSPQLHLASLAGLGKLSSSGSPGPAGPEGAPIPHGPALAAPTPGGGPKSVDGIQCLGSEQLAFHIHAHLTLFVNGAPRQIPAGVGIQGPQVQQTQGGAFVGNGSCFYWLHTHAADGIIHMESPVNRAFTLGNFFDVWGQQLTQTRVGPVRGKVTAIYNGKLDTGNPRDIPLTAHAQIQLEVGTPLVSPVKIAFPNGL